MGRKNNNYSSQKGERILHKIIREICSEKQIEFQKLSYDWIIQLKKDGKIRHIVGNRFDLNKEAAGNIACDKYATYEVLKSEKIPVVEHKLIFNSTDKSFPDDIIWNEIIEYFNRNKNRVVVKPNKGCEGQGVYLCETLNEVKEAIMKLFKTNPSISICPHYEINTEYRAFYLNGECYLVYGKTKPYVIGDGKHCVSKLISMEDLELPENNVVKENLHSIDMKYIPEKDEKYYISWKHNLSGGATPKIIDDELLKGKIVNLIKRVGIAMNITFATIDVIYTCNDELYLLEVNSGICMTKFINKVDGGYDIAKNIYAKAIDKMFE